MDCDKKCRKYHQKIIKNILKDIKKLRNYKSIYDGLYEKLIMGFVEENIQTRMTFDEADELIAFLDLQNNPIFLSMRKEFMTLVFNVNFKKFDNNLISINTQTLPDNVDDLTLVSVEYNKTILI